MAKDVRRVRHVMTRVGVRLRRHPGGEQRHRLQGVRLGQHPVMRHRIGVHDGERDPAAGLHAELPLRELQAGRGLEGELLRGIAADFRLPANRPHRAGGRVHRRMGMRMGLLGDGRVARELLEGLRQGMGRQEDVGVAVRDERQVEVDLMRDGELRDLDEELAPIPEHVRAADLQHVVPHDAGVSDGELGRTIGGGVAVIPGLREMPGGATGGPAVQRRVET